MYLKKIVLHGFKSFPDKTELDFKNGVTVVVGPNGSGKSNISDAMRWVLGEISSKNIRGTRMEDVIFSGTNSRPPMGFAEVSVTFDNSPETGRIDYPDDEITVTRRLYRAGESEYLINRKPVRLKDITELFMSTGIGREGYSIIGQGRIAEILSKKSEDRRNIFEEAAGISKFRHRKQETERKLEAADENYVRINDIFSELSARIGPLEKESEKARRYLDYYEQKKNTDVSLWLYDIKTMGESIAKAENDFGIAKTDLTAISDKYDRLEEENDRVFRNAQDSRQRSEHIWNEIKKSNDSINSLESEYKVAANDIAHFEEKQTELKASIEKHNSNLASLQDEKTGYISRTDELKQLIREEEDKKAGLEKEKEDEGLKAAELSDFLEKSLEEYRSLESERNELNVRISVVENAIKNDAENYGSIRTEIEELDKKILEHESSIKNHRDSISDYNEKLGSTSALIEDLKKEKYAREESLAALEKEKSEIVVKKLTVTQKIDTLTKMEEQLEGFSAGVRYVMKEYGEGKIKGVVHGPVSRLIKVDDEYLIAVETALGANIQNIVVDNESTAKEAIYALKRASAGRATFYPISSVRPQRAKGLDEAKSQRGFVGFADGLVKTDPLFNDIISYLLGRTAVFDDMENASDAARKLGYSVKIVTLDGQQINVGGSYTGGSVKRDSGMLTRSREIEKLKNELNALDKALDSKEKKIGEESAIVSEKDESLKKAEEDSMIIKMMIVNEESELRLSEARLSQDKESRNNFEDDYTKFSGRTETNEQEIDNLRGRSEELGSLMEEINSKREETSVKMSEAGDRVSSLISLISDSAVELARLLKELEMVEGSVTGLEARMESVRSDIRDCEDQIVGYSSEIENLRSGMEENRKKLAEAESGLDSLNTMRESTDSDILKLEKKLSDLKNEIKDTSGQKEICYRSFSKAENKLFQLKNDNDKIIEKMWDDYELTHSSAIESGYQPVNAQDRAAAVSRQNELKNKLKSLGNVNVGAIEEYAEVKARHDKLSIQMQDIEKTEKELRGIISELENEMRAKFTETFNAINSNFSVVFKELFGGGTAEIYLSDPEDVLNSGIEIKAAPPGKIIKSLSLLSGGEQAFVAIALFFAILKHCPTPFSILDEIEAALDEVNVDRFAEYVKKYSDNTQFVIITHRRGTMDAADRLYGITMPQKGVSKILSVDVSEIEEYKKELQKEENNV
ncbi:MAG: chromosome segregation protein SMC [Clostridia bacterium]|nr:chromosome segregation protein SMC [Clostridia bacterium]